MDELETLKALYKTQRTLFLQTLKAIDEQLDNQKYDKARYVVEQTYILLTEYPIKDGDK